MLAAVSSREISEWQAFEADHGPIWLRPDWGPAMIASTVANCTPRDTRKYPEPFEVKDFLIGGVPEWEQTPEQMAAIFEMTAAAERAREEQMERLPR